MNVALKSRFEHENSKFNDSHLEWEMIILFLLNLGMQIDPNDPSLVNVLHVVCLRGNLEYVQKLANGRANVHAVGYSQEKYFRLGTALHAAVIGDQLRVVQYLIEIGVDVHQKAFYQDPYNGDRLAEGTAIQVAFCATRHHRNRWDVLKVLLEIWDGTDDCTTGLDAAIRYRKADVVDFLLRRSIEPPNASKLLHIEHCQDVGIVKLLIDHGILAYLPSEMMMKWQRYTITLNHNVSLLELLVAQRGLLLHNPLSHLDLSCYDCEDRCSATAQFLLERYGCISCDVNATFQEGRSLIQLEGPDDTNILLKACKSPRSRKTLKVLLEHGADPDGPGLADTVLTRLFRKPKRFSRYYKSPEQSTIRQLLDHGADINGSKRSLEEAEKHPRTLQPPLLRAVEDRMLPMVEFLVSNGADVNATSGPETPLHLARREGFDEIADYLMLHGAIDRHEAGEMGRRFWERPGLTPVTTESLEGYDQLRFP